MWVVSWRVAVAKSGQDIGDSLTINPTAHNSRRHAPGELPLRPDHPPHREEHVADARGPSIDPVRLGLARAAYDRLLSVLFARAIGVLLRQDVEYDLEPAGLGLGFPRQPPPTPM